MPPKGKGTEERTGKTRGGLFREVAYLYGDELAALEERSRRDRCSKSEVVRRALREYLALPLD